ncbi:MAG: efflux transporter outer membrane subunit [Legionellales bacterium]|nr:efflux transporter outer membrane subunit [Legionellales bacterium]
MKRCWIVLSLIFLGGCTALPPVKPSDVSIPKATRSGIKIVDDDHDFSHLKWWKKMHDPVLNHVIEQALENNQQIQTASANILQAKATVQAARFSWLPTLGAEASGFVGGGWDSSFTPEGALARSPVLTKMGSMHFRGYYSGFVPSYSLNILENIHKNKWANASLDLQRAAYQSTRLSIISQVTGTYFMLLGQKEQLRIQSQLVRDLKNLRQLEKLRFQAGASDLSTVTEIDEQLANSLSDLVPIQNSLHQLENALSVLLGRNPAPFITHARLKMPALQGLIPPKIPSGVLKKRPDIIMADANLRMTEAQLGIAYAAFFPNISLTGLLGRASLDLSHLLDVSTGLWVTQAAASMPLLNGSTYAQISASKASYLATYHTYVQTLKSAFSDVDNSLTNQQNMNRIKLNQLQALRASKRSYDLVYARSRAGAQGLREELHAKVTYEQAQLKLVLATMQQLDALVGVYQSLAGGMA